MASIPGIVYTVITICLVATIVFVNHKIRFITNTYWFWLIVAAISFIWVLANRFIPDWIQYWQNHERIYENIRSLNLEEQRLVNKMISRAFMLDACPFFFSLLMLTLIIDPSRRLARIFSPIALVGGLTALFTILTQENEGGENAVFTAEYIFFGVGVERCFFIMHWLQVIISVGVLLNMPKSGWRVWLTSLGSFAIYLAYVGIVMTISGCCWYCTGLAVNDYTQSTPELPGGGEYRVVIEITKLPKELWWVCPIILLPILAVVGIAFGGVAHDYVFSTKWIWKYGNIPSGNKYKYWNYNKFGKPNKMWW